MDLIRQYGVIVDWGSGELLKKTTAQFRAMLKTRTVPYWALRKKAAGARPTLKVA
jgi:N-methylhydantoinase B